MTTLAEVARVLIQEHGSPMHVRDLCAAIQARELYAFRAKDPRSVLAGALQTKSRPPGPDGGPAPWFAKTAPATFGLHEWSRPAGPAI